VRDGSPLLTVDVGGAVVRLGDVVGLVVVVVSVVDINVCAMDAAATYSGN
jgi:hypothetical protein